MPVRPLIAAFALALTVAPVGAQAPVTIDWDLAVATFHANRADGAKPPIGKKGAHCGAYWTAQLGALSRKQFPAEAIAKFDPELASGDEASLNAMVFSQLTNDANAYMKGKDEAAATLAKFLAGDRASLVSYFKQLGRCSMGAG